MNVDHQFDKNSFTQRLTLSTEESEQLVDRHAAGLSEPQKADLVGYLDQISMLMGVLGAPLYDETLARAFRVFADTMDMLRPELLKGAAAAEQWRRADDSKGN